MSCKTPCVACQSVGLPILFTRYAAAYSAQSQGMTALDKLQPKGQLQSAPGGVAIKTARYNVRLLRPGYLYLLSTHLGETPKWAAYVVHPHGYLSKFEENAPQNAQAHPACEVEIRGANKTLVWLDDPQRVESLFYMFHPDPIDYTHLRGVIQATPAKYMQRFDAKAWAAGSMTQKDTCLPADLNAQVVEFAALNNETLRDAIEPQMYGLMGANPQERGWGDYASTEQRTLYTAMGDEAGTEEVDVKIKGHTYRSGHSQRLQKIAEMLEGKKGVVVACEDPVGIAQELGHLQAEAWTPYTHWQNAQAVGFFAGVSNEWVYQTALGATGLMEMIKKGAIAKTEARIQDWNAHALPAPAVYRDEATHDVEIARRQAAKASHQQSQRDRAGHTGQAEYAALFNHEAAKSIKAAQLASYDATHQRLRALGADQVECLNARAILRVIDRYSRHDTKVHLPGGGAACSLQLAQSLAGIESNPAGQALLRTLEPAGGDLLGRMLCFNSASVQATLEALNASAAPAALPGSEPTTAVADSIADKLKLQAGKMGLGDKALGFIEIAPRLGDSAALRQMAWPLHIASLMSVKLMQSVTGLPVTAVEARVVRFAAMTGLTTLGRTAAAYAQELADTERSRVTNAVRQLNRQGVQTAVARKAAPSARASALSALFDVGFALIKGQQLQVKGDTRTSVELLGNMLQGIGSIADFRAKAYEETVQKGLRGKNLFTATAQAQSFEMLNAMQLSALRITAFRFLLPAAMVSVFWDVSDGFLSYDRNQYFLSGAQFAGVFGTIFTITATGMAAYGAILGISTATWAAAAATLGLMGAVLVLGSFLVVLALKEDEWLNWLRDNPLNSQRQGQKPIHNNLKDTLQQLANAQAAV